MADMNDNSRPLPRLGEIVVAKGLVSAEALAHALGVQAQTGEKLGHVLSRLGYVTQHEIERCFTEDMIGPILVREMDALSEGKYSQLPGATFTFSQNIQIGLIFMAVAIARSYVIRRWFNARIHAAAMRLAGE